MLAFYYWAVLVLAQHDKGVQRFKRAADATRDSWIFDHFVFSEMRAQQRNCDGRLLHNDRRHGLQGLSKRIVRVVCAG